VAVISLRSALKASLATYVGPMHKIRDGETEGKISRIGRVYGVYNTERSVPKTAVRKNRTRETGEI